MEQDLIKLIAELIPGWTAADWGEIKEKVDSTGFVSEEGEPYSKTALQRIWKEHRTEYRRQLEGRDVEEGRKELSVDFLPSHGTISVDPNTPQEPETNAADEPLNEHEEHQAKNAPASTDDPIQPVDTDSIEMQRRIDKIGVAAESQFGPRKPEPSDTSPGESGEPCEPCDTSQTKIPPEWVAHLRKLIRQEMQTVLMHETDPGVQRLPPPTPRKPKSKEFEGERETLPGCRVDKVLADLFQKERARSGIGASDLMQRILWEHYRRPALSFEAKEE